MPRAVSRSIPHPLPRPRRARLPLLGLALLILCGCQTGSVGPLARWRMARDGSLAEAPTGAEVGDTRGRLARWLYPHAPKSSAEGVGEAGTGLVLGSDGWSPLKAPKDPVAEAEFQEAETLFQQGQLADAEKKFKQIAKKRKETHWGEKAQFFLAECQYQQGNLTAANDSYETLLQKHPGTQYLEKAVGRQYAIATLWLASLDPDAKPEDKPSLNDRRTGKFPTVDTSGHALAALEHVRHHDPTGPLADDAVMKIADYHFAHGNWEDAWIHYDQLITDHPKSPLVHQALLSTVDAKMKGYIGPDYDGTGLEQAKTQIVQAMASFPERQASTADDLNHKIEIIEAQQAERAFKRADHYLWTGKVASAEFCFGEIPVKWPKSPYAKQSKEKLAYIATLPRKETKASTIMTQPGSSDPITGTPGVSQGMGGPNGIGGPGGFMGGMGP